MAHDDPKLIKRHCGGWLAVSNKHMGLKIGVWADTEEEARAKFAVTLAEWRDLLSASETHQPMRQAVASDFGLVG